METNRYLLTVELDGTRYRGAYSLDQEYLVAQGTTTQVTFLGAAG